MDKVSWMPDQGRCDLWTTEIIGRGLQVDRERRLARGGFLDSTEEFWQQLGEYSLGQGDA
jgi:hypothetical protein